MNLILRLKNKTVLTAVVAVLVAIVYQGLGFLGIVPSISASDVINWFGLVISLFVLLGVVTDPTTGGIKDSTRALSYTEPYTDKEA